MNCDYTAYDETPRIGKYLLSMWLPANKWLTSLPNLWTKLRGLLAQSIFYHKLQAKLLQYILSLLSQVCTKNSNSHMVQADVLGWSGFAVCDTSTGSHDVRAMPCVGTIYYSNTRTCNRDTFSNQLPSQFQCGNRGETRLYALQCAQDIHVERRAYRTNGCGIRCTRSIAVGNSVN